MTSHNFPNEEEDLENKFQDEIQLDSKWDELNFEQEKKEKKNFSLSNSKVKQKTTNKAKKGAKGAKGPKKVYKLKTAKNYDLEENNESSAFQGENIHQDPEIVEDKPNSEDEREEQRLQEEEEQREEEERIKQIEEQKKREREEEEERIRQAEAKEEQRRQEREEKRRREEEEQKEEEDRIRQIEEEREEERRRGREEQAREEEIVKVDQDKSFGEPSKMSGEADEEIVEESFHNDEDRVEADQTKKNSFIPDSRLATKRIEDDEIEVENLSSDEEKQEEPVEEPKKQESVPEQPKKKSPRRERGQPKEVTLPRRLPKREYLEDMFEERIMDIVNVKKTIALNDNLSTLFKGSFEQLDKNMKVPETQENTEEEVVNLSEEALAKVDEGVYEDFVELIEKSDVSFEELKSSPLSAFQPIKLNHLILKEKSRDKLLLGYPYVRQPRTDGNSFYRCLLLGLIEVILFQGNGDLRIHKLVYSFSKITHTDPWNKQKADLLLVFKYLLENLNEIDSEVLYCNFLKMVVLKPELDLVSS